MAAQEQLSLSLTSGGLVQNVGAAQDTSEAWILTKAIDAGDSRFPKFLDQCFVNLSNRQTQANMSLEIYGSDEEDGPFVLLQTLPLSVGDPVNPNVAAMKYFKFKFIDRGVRERWRLGGFDITGEALGEEY